jgi:serine protease DegS/serine protease DegQ
VTLSLGLALGLGSLSAGAAALADEPTSDDPPVLEALETAFAAAAARVAPAVVGVEADVDPEEQARREEDVPAMQRRPGSPASGVIVGAGGLVLTSQRNVDGATAIRVVLPGGGRLPADVVSTDDELDLALLRIFDAPADLPVLRPESGAAPAPGSWLIVVGFGPDGSHTINTGVVSATGRFEGRMLQTDAALSHTNRGGAAVDIEGRLVGVAVHASNRTGVNSGVGFLAASRHIADRLPRLAAGESLTRRPRGFLGIRLGEEQLEPAGVAIAEVLDGHAAKASGMRGGDIVRTIGGHDITDARSLSRTIRRYSPGDEVKVVVLRGEEELELTVALGERPDRER